MGDVGASRPIKVLFIGGYGRSGSTLLDRVLGGIDGLCSVGELRHVFREGYVENRLCGCGEPFRECEFWGEVTARAFGDMESFDARGTLELQERVDRWWRAARLAGPRGRGRPGAELEAYRATLRSLYRGIASVSDARVIVDSSKDVSHGYALRGVGDPLKPYVLHLVRDSRAVAHSWQRQKFNPGSGVDMDRYGLVRTSAEWMAINALTALHSRLGAPYRRLRYQDFVTDPRAAVSSILDFLGEPTEHTRISARRTVELGEDHTVAGNPIRFRRGEIEVRRDDEWRTRMPPRSKALVTALTLPALALALTGPRPDGSRW
jgi:hypothetical protein